jgi:flavin reductase (DIM6/NTAB) family NADH-FMN oxidoreductase RutF
MGDVAGPFREVMAGVCTPVAVVTSLGPDGPHGTTVSAFASLSMSPPMVMVALDRRSDLLRLLWVDGPFGVNVLGSHQAQLAAAFARKGADKFSGVAWATDTDAPRLADSPGWLACRVTGLVDGGDHVIVLGEVRRAEAGDGAPLTYHDRRFGTHAPAA